MPPSFGSYVDGRFHVDGVDDEERMPLMEGKDVVMPMEQSHALGFDQMVNRRSSILSARLSLLSKGGGSLVEGLKQMEINNNNNNGNNNKAKQYETE